MRKALLLFILLLFNYYYLFSQTTIYLFPGQGSDYRVFSKTVVPHHYDTVIINYPVPEKKMSMDEYAAQLIAQIDTSSSFILLGYSLGGMLATELSAVLKPEFTIVVSSAKQQYELPWRYRFQKQVPLYALFPKCLIKVGALLIQPLVEPDRKKEKATFKAMLKAKDSRFLKRSIYMIVNWDRVEVPANITHIHGTKDHTLPYRKVNTDYKVDKGSHMMILTESERINRILKKILSD
jgi:pimeloyl-ACP methyl ester carboxylesterase